MLANLASSSRSTAPRPGAAAFCELDVDGYGTRKVEVYADGRVGFADAGEVGGTASSIVPIESFDPDVKPAVSGGGGA